MRRFPAGLRGALSNREWGLPNIPTWNAYTVFRRARKSRINGIREGEGMMKLSILVWLASVATFIAAVLGGDYVCNIVTNGSPN